MNFKKYMLSSAAAVIALGMASCVSDLDVTPIDPNSVMEVDEAALFTKCYANMALAGNTGANGDCDIDGLDGGTTGFVRQLWNANELTTDEAICCWGDDGIPQFNNNQWDASHPMLRGFYYRLYVGIDYCNHYLDVCAGADETHEAEVRFLRCLYYYYLLDCWGNVPFAMQISAESPHQIKRADLYAWIEAELLGKEVTINAMDDNSVELFSGAGYGVVDKLVAPASRKSTDEGYGRADKDAAYMLLARLYLNAEVYTGTAHWADAQTYAELVVNGPHKLNTTSSNGFSAYQMLFMGDNGETAASSEAVLALLQDGVTTTSWGTALFLMASTWKSDMDENSNYGTTEFWAGNRARRALLDKFFPTSDAPQVTISGMVAAANDERALFHGKDRSLTCETWNEFTSGYSCGKFRNTYTTGAAGHNSQFVDMDFFLMRSAEAYLISAEADARLNGGTTSSTGASRINSLRARANCASRASSYSLDDILDERARELYYEGFRRTDLIRFGYYGGANSAKYVWEYKGGVYAGSALASTRNLFALPDEDMNANPNLKQNEGY